MTKYDQVLIGIVRKTLPSIIAHDIIGVSPMTAPIASIFSLRAQYVATGRLNNYYRYFLRLNNRRKLQREVDFEKAGYPFVVTTADYLAVEWKDWMKENIGQYQYFRFGPTVFFEDKKLLVLFQLRWG